MHVIVNEQDYRCCCAGSNFTEGYTRCGCAGYVLPPPLYLVLAGLPASGKSTLRQEIIDAWRGHLQRVSTDDYIDSVAKAAGSTYTAVFKIAIDDAERFANSARSGSLRIGNDIIHDQTNLTPGKRRKRLSDVPENYMKACLFVEIDEEERQRRLKSRPGKEIPDHVDHFMTLTWERPTLVEGWDIVAPGAMWRTVLDPWSVRQAH
jgi:tRNA uridine 5-carbamoylmethylation protein Kti12